MEKEKILEALKQGAEKEEDNLLDYTMRIIRPQCVAELNQSVASCETCECCKNGFHSQIYGDPAKADILIIGDYISEEQTKNARDKKLLYPYQGSEAWNIMQKIMTSFHVKQEALLWANAVSCFPQDNLGNRKLNRIPDTKEVKECKVYTDYLIKVMDPLYIILLGNIAANQYQDLPVKKARGWMKDGIFGIPTMITYSPQFIAELMASDKDKDIVEDYKTDFCDDIYDVFYRLQNDYPDTYLDVLDEKLED